ncbi:MAG: DUF1501 domain-containing protein [Verrucomicrobiota bacterium]
MIFSRRKFLQRSMLGLGAVAATDLMARQRFPRLLEYTPRAKRIIYIFLEGGLSQMDSYDYKPALQQFAGQPLPDSIKQPDFTFAPQGAVIPSPFSWKNYGETGMYASDLFPRVNSQHIDDLCFLHSLHHDANDHVTAKTVLHTGVPIEVRPTLGSWLIYGLGSENENLPGYIDIAPSDPNRPTGFLPSEYMGTAVSRPDKKKVDLVWENLKPRFHDQKSHIDFIQSINRAGETHAADKTISQMEMAFRMQTEAPEIMDLNRESTATQKLYGMGDPHTDEFGRALLLARRFSEAGVRYVTITHATPKYGNLWDQHSELERGHRGNANAVDAPIAGLLHDLKVRGMLEDTLVMCGSEFGRTPTFEFFDGATGKHQNGRDHNPHGFTMWFAGGGTKPGYRHGATDDFGYFATRDRVDIHDLHANVLKIMGIDHEALTYFHTGREFRLTDVHGYSVDQMLA